MNKLTAASLKLHMFGVFVLQTLHAEGKLPEDFDPMSLDTSIVAKFDPNEMKNHFKTNKKTKTNVKVVSSPRENVVGVIANNHYESNQTDDVVMQIVNAAKSDVAEKPKRKPRQKKSSVVSEVAETTESVVVDASVSEPVVVADKPKRKSPPKKKAAPAEPVVSADVETTDSSVAVETTEPVVVEEKPKKKSPPKKKAATAEPVAVVETESAVTVETTEPAVVEEKPKKKSPPKKKAAPAETTEPAVVEEKPKKNAAIKAVKDLVSSVVAEKKEEIVEEPIAENKVEEPIAENKVEEANVTAEEEEDDDEDAEEIQARIMNYEGKQYLIDGDNNIYDKESFDELGTFNADTQKIIFN